MNISNLIKRNIGNLAVIIIVCMLVIGFFYIVFASEMMFSASVYVSSTYGKHCYKKGYEHGNIKYPIEFNSEHECEEYINNK